MTMTVKSCYEEVIIAGFGGQGIILAGKLLTQAAMKAGKEVTYMPSYGAEMRGGTSNCMVVIADEHIASPLVTNPCSLIAMNKASLEKFTPRIRKDGLLIYNSSLIHDLPQMDKSINVVAVPADELAAELKSPKSANMVALGAYLQKSGMLKPDFIAKSLPEVLSKRYHHTLTVNEQALKSGAQFVKDKN